MARMLDSAVRSEYTHYYSGKVPPAMDAETLCGKKVLDVHWTRILDNVTCTTCKRFAA